MENKTKKCTKCNETKSVTEFCKRSAARDGLHPQCKSCRKEYGKKYFQENKEKRMEYQKQYNFKHKDELKEHSKQYCEKHKEQRQKYFKAHYQKNKDEILTRQKQYYKDTKEERQQYQDEYNKNNRHKRNKDWMKRHATKLNATPPWLTKEMEKEIEQFYGQAFRLTEETGIKHVVDHMVPLCSDQVSGFHVPWNLQVIPEEENLSKSNSTWPDMPEDMVEAQL
jgi:hypothetical protein